ncbi:hypothetical protein [Mucilaginibacter segetis]|uniref:Uncharacterized protein n=1 Tax=Mucilaginibacter segetis TaxID=2793071 RepID=A0A934PTZ7_9SPHI|nr:hypothetical protein [Mucilaginibacter segetis]MBK0379532.1 hypothetical protein [Mucilaginibacter segetis]
MKYLLKVIIPLVPFWVFAVLIKFTPFFHYVNAGDTIGEDSVYGLIAYYKVFAPLLMLIAVITQYLMVMPLWNIIRRKPKSTAGIFISMFFISLLLAFGLAYIIWDPVTGYFHFASIGLFMAGVQVFYWTINFLVLYLLDWKVFGKAVSVPITEHSI